MADPLAVAGAWAWGRGGVIELVLQHGVTVPEAQAMLDAAVESLDWPLLSDPANKLLPCDTCCRWRGWPTHGQRVELYWWANEHPPMAGEAG